MIYDNFGGQQTQGTLRRCTLLTLAALVVSALLAGCGSYRVCPDVSQVPPGIALPIDGLWRAYSGEGRVLKIERGRAYFTTAIADGLPPNRVIAKDIQRISSGHYTGLSESYNLKKRQSAYGPTAVDIVGDDTICWTDEPNPKTGSEGATILFVSSQLDDEQAFLRELIEMPDANELFVYSAVQKLTDQALLSQLINTLTNSFVRMAAIERSTDESVLAKVASEDADSNIRRLAVGKIHDQALLAKVVTTASDYIVRLAAVEQIADESVLLKVALENKNSAIRKLAAGKIHDQALLSQLINTSTNVEVRMVAIERSTDESVLVKVASEDKDSDIQRLAVGRIHDQALLSQLINTSSNVEVRKAAVERSTDESVLAKVVFEDADSDIQRLAVGGIHDQALLSQLINTSSNVEVRRAAVIKITDESVLVKVASKDADILVRNLAVGGIHDQAQLAKVVTGAKDWDIRKAAFGRIHDTTQLNAVASGAIDEAVRMAANVRLGKSTWSDIINEAIQNDAKIGPAISAIAWAEKQENLVEPITGLCHRYIRKGDETRIRELRELLRLYGDKTLAEDYLNCGQSDLSAAGRDWANSRGYNVGTGNGSNRVRWGAGSR